MQGQGRRQFRIGPCLGRGGYGAVYRAIMRSPGGLETTVALKVLREGVIVSDDAIRRLLDEGRLLGRINHPVVVRAFDFTFLDQQLALVTEFIDGDDLEHCLQEPGRIGLRALLQVISRLASALDAAYSATDPAGKPLRIVHRDIKPSNVRIGRHGEVKLLDFGIARFQPQGEQTRPVSEVMVGSVPYLSPERLMERASLPEGDIFGLGCLLYEGIAGERFHADGSLRAVSAVCSDPERFAHHLQQRLAHADAQSQPEGLPEAVRALVRRCLAFDPSERPRAKDLSVTCEALADELPGLTLKRWCSARSWRGADETSAGLGAEIPPPDDLSGRIHAEEPSIEALPPARERSRPLVMAIGVLTFGCLGLGTGILLSALGIAGLGFFVGWP